MANKTINQALRDLFLGLGGDPTELSDNTSVSDYIEDLESAIEGKAADLIDDTEASETKTYSSSKIASLIPSLPTPSSSNKGRAIGVNAGGTGYTTYGLLKQGSGNVSFFKDGTGVTCTKTVTEIENLIDTTVLYATVTDASGSGQPKQFYASLVSYERYGADVRFTFAYFDITATTPCLVLFTLSSTGVIESNIAIL